MSIRVLNTVSQGTQWATGTLNHTGLIITSLLEGIWAENDKQPTFVQLVHPIASRLYPNPRGKYRNVYMKAGGAT